jgi:hypothetical protein
VEQGRRFSSLEPLAKEDQMTRDEIISMAREAGFEFSSLGGTYTSGKLDQHLERFAALVAAAERNKLAAWMIAKGYATGHGDTTDDLLGELGWQIAEKLKMERESCAQIAEEWLGPVRDRELHIAAAIRARGKA